MNTIQNYTFWKTAINRAEKDGYEVHAQSDGVRLTKPNGHSPEFRFFEPAEIHCYLNGIMDARK